MGLSGVLKSLVGSLDEPFKAYNFLVMLSPAIKVNLGKSSGNWAANAVVNAAESATKLAASYAASYAGFDAAAVLTSLLGGFTSIEGVGWKTEVRKVREGGVNDYEYVLPGRTTCNELVLSKGLTLLDPMSRWYSSSALGRVLRMNGTIFLMQDRPVSGGGLASAVPLAAWSFLNAWPTALEGVHFDASQSLVAVQRLTLAVETIVKI